MTSEQAETIINLLTTMKEFTVDAYSFALGLGVALIIAVTWRS